MRTLVNLRPSVIAIVTIIAMLLVPLCGTSCAAMSHCSTSAVSATAEGCHHADMSGQSDSEDSTLSSQAACAQQAPLMAILASSESSAQLSSVLAMDRPLSIDSRARNLTPDRHFRAFLLSIDSLQTSIPFENLSVLRI
jgi:hypothetical protein